MNSNVRKMENGRSRSFTVVLQRYEGDPELHVLQDIGSYTW